MDTWKVSFKRNPDNLPSNTTLLTHWISVEAFLIEMLQASLDYQLLLFGLLKSTFQEFFGIFIQYGVEEQV